MELEVGEEAEEAEEVVLFVVGARGVARFTSVTLAYTAVVGFSFSGYGERRKQEKGSGMP